jgi:nicotinamidase/pyrazinamidase
MSRKQESALIVVDLQNDFIPGGALPVKDGDKVIPLIDQLVKLPFKVKVATKDWHPSNHGSFASNHKNKQPGDLIQLRGIEQILWPKHCVQNTQGSEFSPGWDFNQIEKVFFKGTDPTIDSYSTFFDNGHLKSTGLGDYLIEKEIKDIYIAGLATDYCVKYSVLDSLKLGFKTHVIVDACRGVNLKPTDSDEAIRQMREAGAGIVTFSKIKLN